MKRTMLQFGLLALVLGFSACRADQSYIDDPKVGDVYLIEEHNVVPDSPISYSLVKVKAIQNDSILLTPNVFHYHDKVYCLSSADYFNSGASYYNSKEQIKSKYKDGVILEVTRVYEKACLGHDK
jgi:hypothetical protein